MSYSEIKKSINSDLLTPLDVTIGKKTDVASTTATSSVISWLKGIHAYLTTYLPTIYSNSSRSAIKSIQRGSTNVAGTITISAVTMSKAFVYSVSKGSEGYVAARGTFTSTGWAYSANQSYIQGGGGSITGTMSDGTTSLTTRQYSAVLASTTTITCDGAVQWQVIEYY